ncbi:MAG TPA: mechanosensitive ion channel family protein [Terriglobales bacterium]|nr:mechanosensitive ion channel family protein [Terriglobales bacterium]
MLPATHELTTLRDVLRDWRGDALQFLRVDVPKIVVVVVVAGTLIRLLRLVTRRLVQFSQKHDLSGAVRAEQLRTAAGVINSVGTFVISFLALMQILPVLGINMGPLLASAGIAGLALGFGAQTLVKDVINGFFIVLENQYSVGDVVRIAGVHGKVEEMTMRRTNLRDDDGTLHVVPNSEIHIVSNLTRDWAQVALHISVAYTENSERVLKLLQEVGEELRNDPNFRDDIVAQPEVPGIERVSNGEVDYLMLVRTRPGRQYAVSRELRRRIKASFEKNGVQAGNPARVYVMDRLPEASNQ